MARLPVLLLALATVLVLAPARAATAATCARELEDPGEQTWDIHQNGGVFNGNIDAYNLMSRAAVAHNGTNNETEYVNPAPDGCTTEDGGREIVFPVRVNINNTGVSLYRKVYVPASGPAFARWLDVIFNPVAVTRTVSFMWFGFYEDVTGVTDTAGGDQLVDVGERWASFVQDGDSDFGTEVASLWDGPGAPDHWDRPYNDTELSIPGDDGEDQVRYMYDGVVVPPGATVIFMHVERQSFTAVDAHLFARENGDGIEAFFAGMSPAEMFALRNWSPPDADHDFVLDGADNCPSVANGGQVDGDGDGVGDRCDDDRDGDGMSNDAEASLGTDPDDPDSDGDGVADGSDRCALVAGPEQGCPVPSPGDPPPGGTAPLGGTAPPGGVVAPPTPPRVTPGMALTVRRARTRRRLTLRLAGRVVPPRGVSAAEACASGAVMLVIRARARTAFARLVELRPDCTIAATATLNRRGLRRRRLVAQAQFSGNGRLLRAASPLVAAGRG
ncbi:MAG TPA: thrombospondin type 3 repeat-containing protein [Solirubrobacteraceae bacterium]|jgi:hypothetical protein